MNFLLMNGDVLTDVDMGSLYGRSRSRSTPLHVSAYERTHLVDFGVLETNSENRLTASRKNPS